MVKKALSVFNYMIFLLLGVLFLWLVFRNLKGEDIVAELRNANYFWIGLGMVAGLLSHLVRAARWNILIGSMGYKTRLSTTFYAVMTGYLANTAVPRLGEVTRCGVLSKKQNIPFTELLGSVIAERLFDMVVLLLIIFFVIIFQLERVGTFVEEKIFSGMFSNFEGNLIPILIVVGGLLLFALLIYVLWRLFKNKFKNYTFFKKLEQFGKGMAEGFKTIKRTKNKTGFFAYTIIMWGLYTSMIYLPFFALEGTSGLSFVDALTVMSIGSLGMVAPVPGGIGAFHWIVKAILFELYGVEAFTAASFATITHAAQTLMIIVVGGLSFLMLFLQKNRTDNGSS